MEKEKVPNNEIIKNQTIQVSQLKAKKAISKELSEFFLNWSLASTTHGFGPIFRNKYVGIKIMWFCFLLASAGLCLLTLIDSLKDYLEYKVNTNIELVNDKDAHFPSVSLCSKYKVKLYDLTAISKI